MNGYKEKKLRHDDKVIRELIAGDIDCYHVRDISSDLESKTAIYRLVGTVDMSSSSFVEIAKKHQGAFLVRGGDSEWEFALPCELNCERLDKMVQVHTAAVKELWNRVHKKTKRYEMVGLYKEDSTVDADSSPDSISSDCDLKAVKGNKENKHSRS